MPDTHNKQLPASPSCSDEDNFGLLLHFVRQGLIRHLEQALAAQDLGLSFTQYRVLKMLTNVPHLGASELARRLEHDAGALTRLLDTLDASRVGKTAVRSRFRSPTPAARCHGPCAPSPNNLLNSL